MSSIRSRHDLRGTDRVPKDGFPHRGPEGFKRDEIHPSAQSILEAAADANEVEEPGGTPELDQNVDVAVGPVLATGSRPKERQRRHTEPIQLRPDRSQRLEDHRARRHGDTAASMPSEGLTAPARRTPPSR